MFKARFCCHIRPWCKKDNFVPWKTTIGRELHTIEENRTKEEIHTDLQFGGASFQIQSLNIFFRFTSTYLFDSLKMVTHNTSSYQVLKVYIAWGENVFKCAIPGLFFFIFVFSMQLTVYKICQWLHLNHGHLVLEAGALPSQLQPLPHCFFLKNMCQTRPLFVYFRSFHMTNIAQIL